MMRRAIVTSTVLLLLGGASASALASTTDSDTNGEHYLCVLGKSTPSGPDQGLCVWIPTK